MTRPFHPEALWNEILPGLFQGGTHEDDELGAFLKRAPQNMPYWHADRYIEATQVKAEDFDTVVTAYSGANPCGRNVKELRFTFFDGNMNDFNPEQDLFWLVREAHQDWKSGKRVLIRCQAGLNRSGLIMALVLIREGHTPEEAIELIRDKRCESALCNDRFVAYLVEQVDVDYWRKG